MSLFLLPHISGWVNLLLVYIEPRLFFGIQATILLHLNDYVVIKGFKRDLPSTKLFDEESHYL